jgi:hypothetical protein
VANFSRHALEKMEERGITREEVEAALARPAGLPTPGQPGSIWIWGHAGSRILKVCVRVNDRQFVITAAWPGQEEVRS